MRQRINKTLYCLSDLTELVYFKKISKKSGVYNENNPRVDYPDEKTITTRVARIKKQPFAIKGKMNNISGDEITDIFVASYDNVKAEIDTTWTIQWGSNNYQIKKLLFIEEAGRQMWIEFHARIKGNNYIQNNF